MSCIEQKICLSNISCLYKATESHEYQRQRESLTLQQAEYISVWYSNKLKTVNYSYTKAVMAGRFVQEFLCFWLAHYLLSNMMKLIQTFVKGCAKLLYLQKWHKSECNSQCTCTPIHIFNKESCPHTVEPRKSTSFNDSW